MVDDKGEKRIVEDDDEIRAVEFGAARGEIAGVVETRADDEDGENVSDALLEAMQPTFGEDDFVCEVEDKRLENEVLMAGCSDAGWGETAGNSSFSSSSSSLSTSSSSSSSSSSGTSPSTPLGYMLPFLAFSLENVSRSRSSES